MRHDNPCGRPSLAMVLTGLVAVAILAAAALPVQPAAAQDGVHFDPDSPAGKEYALPLDQARDEASGGGSDRAPGVRAPLFGAGVSDRDPGSERKSGAEGDVNGQVNGQGGNGEADIPAGGPTTKGDREVRLSAAGNGYPLMRGIGMAAAVVLLGGVLALAFRGLRRANLP